jgi:energy-converting hydrogenase B subunit D
VTVATLAPLQAPLLLFVAVVATCVALTRDPLRQLLVSGIYGLVLAALFLVLQAPDVSLSMIVASAIAYPLVVLLALGRVRSPARSGDDEQEDEEE